MLKNFKKSKYKILFIGQSEFWTRLSKKPFGNHRNIYWEKKIDNLQIY